MTTDSSQSHNNEQDDLSLTPGQLLHKMRQEQGFSIDELCQYTMLSFKTIDALENDRFEALSQPVYIKGYYRKCAVVLKTNADILLNAYDKYGLNKTQEVYEPDTTANLMSGQNRAIPRSKFPWAIIVVILVILAALYFLWPVIFSNASSPVVGKKAKTSQQTPSKPAIQNKENKPKPNLAANKKRQPSASDDRAQSQAQINGAESRDGQQKDSQKAKSLSHADLGLDASNIGAADTTKNIAKAEKTEQPTQAAPILTLKFEGASWIRVTDATGQRLLQGIYEHTQRSLQGAPPYRVDIGNAPEVSLIYAGERVTTKPARNNTAHVSVGK